jgi:hypothetical protein
VLSRCLCDRRWPDIRTFSRYAKHLEDDHIHLLARTSEGFAGRDIKKIAETVERQYCSELLRSDSAVDAATVKPPPFEMYSSAVRQRARSIVPEPIDVRGVSL